MASKYRLVDIGANLTNNRYAKDVVDVIARAKEAGLVKIMLTGTCVKTSKESLAMAQNDDQHFLYSTAGVHPHDAKHFCPKSTLSLLRGLAESPRCVAVGECGLDFNRMFSPREVQLDVFEQQVQLACELRKPMFVHERDAHEEMVDILTRYQDRLPPTVIHCFTGPAVEAQKYIELGCYIGLTGFLWKDRSDNGVQFALRQRLIPVERLLLETDAPFMYPNVAQKKSKLPKEILERISEHSMHYLKSNCSFDRLVGPERNEPCSLPTTADLIAAFLDMDVAELCEQTTKNAFDVFGLES